MFFYGDQTAECNLVREELQFCFCSGQTVSYANTHFVASDGKSAPADLSEITWTRFYSDFCHFCYDMICWIGSCLQYLVESVGSSPLGWSNACSRPTAADPCCPSPVTPCCPSYSMCTWTDPKCRKGVCIEMVEARTNPQRHSGRQRYQRSYKTLTYLYMVRCCVLF